MAQPISPPHYVSTQLTGPNRSAPGPTAPPRYSDIFEVPVDRIPTGDPPTQHEFSLRSGLIKSKSWVTLRILSRPSKSVQKVPRFFGGDNVSGTIEFKLPQPQIINSISLYLKGRMRTGPGDTESYTFFEHIQTVWNRVNGDPRLGPNSSSKFDGTLSGDFELAFSFPFPTEVDLQPRSVGKGKRPQDTVAFTPTPQTTLGNFKATIEYQLVLQITHGMLRLDSKLRTAVTFVPKITPAMMSDMRQNAYLEGGMLPGPEGDPEGWLTLPKVSMIGEIHGNHEVEMDYSLCLASPISYTRGTVIPCYLFISGSDCKVLDILAHPNLQRVRLVRRIRLFRNVAQGIEQCIQGKEEPKIMEEVDEIEMAVWWIPPKDVQQESMLRRLEGEIHLQGDLLPSSDFLPFRVEYAVEMLPVETDAFQPSQVTNSRFNSKSEKIVMLSHPVTIATFNSLGPLPTAFTEPREQQKVTADSFNAIGQFGSSNLFAT